MKFAVQLATVLLVMLGVIAPLLLYFERKRGAGVLGRLGSAQPEFAGWRVLALFFPTEWVDSLFRPASGAPRPFGRVAPGTAFVSLLGLVALIPVGSRYVFGASSFSLALAPLDWGLFYFFFGSALAVQAYALRFATTRPEVVAATTAGFSFLAAMAAALAGPLLIYGTQDFTEIPRAQDRVVEAFAWSRALGWVDGSFWPWLRLPAWGVFVQPLAFLLFVTSVFALCPRPDLESDFSAAEEPPAVALWMGADLLRVSLAGALVTVFFLGGWSVPYASQATITHWFGDLGGNVASAACLLLHLLSFVAKVSAFLFLFSALRLALPRLNYGEAMNLCWKLLIPLAVANVAFTALILLAMERNP